MNAYHPAKCRPGNAGRWLPMLLVLVIAGCVATPAPTPGSTSAALPTRTPQPTLVANSTPSEGTAASVPTPGPMTLTWWAPEFLSPKAPQPAGPILAEQLAEFESSQDGKVRVAVVSKTRYGKGGPLDFLRTAQSVAPAILPDLVALDVSELEAAAATDLLQPLDGLLDKDLTDNLYPFAVSAGTFEDRLLAVQYAADLDHLVYGQAEVKSPPMTWAALLEAKAPYLLPVGSPQPGASGQSFGGLQSIFISQYLSARASNDPKQRILSVEEEPLLRMLNFYDAAAKGGVLPPIALELADVDAVWNAFAQGAAPLADVSARRYLNEGDESQRQQLRGDARVGRTCHADRWRVGARDYSHRPCPATGSGRSDRAAAGAGESGESGRGGRLVADLARRAADLGRNPLPRLSRREVGERDQPAGWAGFGPGRRAHSEGPGSSDQGGK